jgi:hypothetical protein
MKKTAAQLDREIAESLAASSTTIGRSWESPLGRRTVVAEEGGRLAIKTEGAPFNEILPRHEFESQIVRDEANAVSARKRASAKTVASASEAKEAANRADDSGFTVGMSDVARQRALTVLNTRQGFNGVLRQRKEAIRDMIARGYRVVGAGKNRRLTSPDGSFLTVSDITKTGMDFADHLGT